MEIKLFLNDVSDDYTEFKTHGMASTGWLDSKTKPVLHDEPTASSIVAIDLEGENEMVEHLRHLFLRKEDFGGLVFNGKNGKVYQVDKTAFDFLWDLQSGTLFEDAIKKVESADYDVNEFVKLLKEYSILNDKK